MSFTSVLEEPDEPSIIIFDHDERDNSFGYIEQNIDDQELHITDVYGNSIRVPAELFFRAIKKAIELGWDKPKQSIAEE